MQESKKFTGQNDYSAVELTRPPKNHRLYRYLMEEAVCYLGDLTRLNGIEQLFDKNLCREGSLSSGESKGTRKSFLEK